MSPDLRALLSCALLKHAVNVVIAQILAPKMQSSSEQMDTPDSSPLTIPAPSAVTAPGFVHPKRYRLTVCLIGHGAPRLQRTPAYL